MVFRQRRLQLTRKEFAAVHTAQIFACRQMHDKTILIRKQVEIWQIAGIDRHLAEKEIRQAIGRIDADIFFAPPLQQQSFFRLALGAEHGRRIVARNAAARDRQFLRHIALHLRFDLFHLCCAHLLALRPIQPAKKAFA